MEGSELIGRSARYERICFCARNGWTAGGGRAERREYSSCSELVSAADVHRKSLDAVNMALDRNDARCYGHVMSSL
jgi:hypothetical protein